jgi:hypothetical protein
LDLRKKLSPNRIVRGYQLLAQIEYGSGSNRSKASIPRRMTPGTSRSMILKRPISPSLTNQVFFFNQPFTAAGDDRFSATDSAKR